MNNYTIVHSKQESEVSLMNKECSVCKGSGRQRWWRNPSLSIKREDGSSPGGPSKWVPARKDDAGRRTRSCERCKGNGIDPWYIKEIKLEAVRARHERERIYYMNEKIRGTRCANNTAGLPQLNCTN
ncbi:hypothetical protein KKA01_03170, partial [Patescibacteria group bacterium]|nr:hypothetical protein [Patescibacteria group bacterium]